MLTRASSWFTRPALTTKGSSVSLSAADEPQDLNAVMRAMDHVMNDDIEAAEAVLEKGTTVWYKLGLGAIGFIRSAAGFEQDVMRSAAETLATVETQATTAHRNASRSSHSSSSYPPGTEYSLCVAEASLMAAVIGVLSESIMESMRSFYKLRSAFKTLEGVHKAIEEVEARRLQAGNQSTHSTTSLNSNSATTPATSSLALPSSATPGQVKRQQFENSIDEYIVSGGNLCYGTLLLFISMIPPALTRLLAILGFHGDRKKGLKSLWAAADSKNSHGALGALILSNYYSGIMQFCDIIDEDPENGGFPRERLEQMLATYTTMYKGSPMWVLEESRMQATKKDLAAAFEILEKQQRKPQMRQIEAIGVFEKAMQATYLHKYEYAAELFIKLIDINTWSHAMYHYIAGSCYIELYREAILVDTEKAIDYATKAKDLLLKVAQFIGRKKIMAKALPLEVFADRKVKKWQRLAAERNCDLVEAVGVSPIEEMIYLWNGFKRMNTELLQSSLKVLDWEPPKKLTEEGQTEFTAGKTHLHEVDEKAVHSLLRAVIFRHLGDLTQSREILLEEVLPVDKALLKVNDREDWVAPCAHYEMAVVIWQGSRKEEWAIAKEYIQKCHQWEAYLLDARFGLRVTTALDVIKQYEASLATTTAS